MMLVDGSEDEWLRLHDIRMNGQVLEYVGRGKSLIDVGLAQAKTPICTRNHYFEIGSTHQSFYFNRKFEIIFFKYSNRNC